MMSLSVPDDLMGFWGVPAEAMNYSAVHEDQVLYNHKPAYLSGD